MIPDATLGGYFAEHGRPPAFEGQDGAAYSVAIFTDLLPDDTWASALMFVRWSSAGDAPVGHLETDYLATGKSREESERRIGELSLHDVKRHLDELARRPAPDGTW